MTVTQKLIDEVLAAKFQDIPSQAIDRIKHAILDDVGIAYLGYFIGGKTLVDYAKDVGRGIPESTIIGDGTKVSCMVASGANAQMAYDTDLNEHGPGHHALSAIAQTAISVGERVDASGRDVISAVAIGYEMSGRFHRSLLPIQRPEGMTEGKRHIPIVVAMVAGKLLGLNARQMNHAIGIAWYFKPQPSEFLWRNTWWKRLGNFHLGNCQWGIQAALLAMNGFDGPIDVIDKENFYDLERVLSSPTPYFYPINELHLKPWICSGGVNAGLQAALELVQELDIQVSDIEEVVFKGKKLYSDPFFHFNNPKPQEAWDAIYSVQWAFAMALLGYKAGPDWLKEERLKDPTCLSLASKVRIEEDLEESAVYDRRGMDRVDEIQDHPHEIEIIAKGKRYRRGKLRNEVLGSPTNPFSLEQLTQKFKTQAIPVIGESQSNQLIGLLATLEHQDHVSNVTRFFGPIL
jgi:2-methylcitrate dehydratase PrpD